MWQGTSALQPPKEALGSLCHLSPVTGPRTLAGSTEWPRPDWRWWSGHRSPLASWGFKGKDGFGLEMTGGSAWVT